MTEPTPLKKYFDDNGIKIKYAASKIGVDLNTLYKILSGEARPRILTAENIFRFVKGSLTMAQIRPELKREKCPCCNRLLRKHHLIEKRAREKQHKRLRDQREAELKNEIDQQNPPEKVKRKGLLSP